MGDGQTPALSFGSPQQVRDQPRGGRHGTSRLRVSAEMPAGFWLGIGKEHRAHPGRDNMRRRGSLGARCSLRRGWAPAGPPPGSPGGGRPATGAHKEVILPSDAESDVEDNAYLLESRGSPRSTRGVHPSLPEGTRLFSPRYGQLSGMVEPLAGVFGAFAVVLAEPILPYALAFAAGAMVYALG